MLEVSLPEEIIKLFKLTCRNYTYFDDGKVMLTEEYKKGLRHGKLIRYIQAGDKIGYTLNGKPIIYTREEGAIVYTQKFKKGVLHGDFIAYDIKGALYHKSKYKNGMEIY